MRLVPRQPPSSTRAGAAASAWPCQPTEPLAATRSPVWTFHTTRANDESSATRWSSSRKVIALGPSMPRSWRRCRGHVRMARSRGRGGRCRDGGAPPAWCRPATGANAPPSSRNCPSTAWRRRCPVVVCHCWKRAWPMVVGPLPCALDERVDHGAVGGERDASGMAGAGLDRADPAVIRGAGRAAPDQAHRRSRGPRAPRPPRAAATPPATSAPRAPASAAPPRTMRWWQRASNRRARP
jgi:hypothetical protein